MQHIAHKEFTTHTELLDENFATHEPRLRAALYPRRIISPSTYLNPRHYGAMACCYYRLWMRPDINLLPHTTGQMVALLQSKYGVPTYFIEPLFAEAVIQSKLPEDFYLKDIKWPMPAMLFVLPDTFIRKYFKYYIPFISVVYAPEGTYPESARPYPPTEHEIQYGSELPVRTDRILFHFPLFSPNRTPVDYTGNYELDHNMANIQDSKLVDAVPFDENLYTTQFKEPVPFHPDGPNNAAADKQLQIEVISFALKLMLALTARPEYVEASRIARPEKIKGQHRQEALYHPTMVGTRYRILRPATPAGLPTGRKMPMYWHSGAFSHIAKGKRADFVPISSLPRNNEGRVDWSSIPAEVHERFWACHELKWIEPYLVNAPKAD